MNGERMEVTPMICIDSCLQFWISTILTITDTILLDLTTKVNSFDHLKKNTIFFIKSTSGVT